MDDKVLFGKNVTNMSRLYRNTSVEKLGREKLFLSIMIFPTLFRFGGNRRHQGVEKYGSNRMEYLVIDRTTLRKMNFDKKISSYRS